MTLQQFTPPFVDDGHIEVVGFTSAWHGLVLLAPKGHGTRLAQVRTKKMVLWSSNSNTNMQNEVEAGTLFVE